MFLPCRNMFTLLYRLLYFPRGTMAYSEDWLYTFIAGVNLQASSVTKKDNDDEILRNVKSIVHALLTKNQTQKVGSPVQLCAKSDEAIVDRQSSVTFSEVKNLLEYILNENTVYLDIYLPTDSLTSFPLLDSYSNHGKKNIILWKKEYSYDKCISIREYRKVDCSCIYIIRKFWRSSQIIF